MKTLRTILTLTVAVCACAGASAAAYIKIDGIPGESKDKMHSGWIDVDSQINLDVKAPRDVATGQASGRRQYQPLIIRKRIDKASPLLAKAMAGKQVLGQIVVSNQATRYTLSEVMVSSITTAAGVETVSFTYQKIEMQAAPKVPAAQQPIAEKHRPSAK